MTVFVVERPMPTVKKLVPSQTTMHESPCCKVRSDAPSMVSELFGLSVNVPSLELRTKTNQLLPRIAAATNVNVRLPVVAIISCALSLMPNS